MLNLVIGLDPEPIFHLPLISTTHFPEDGLPNHLLVW